MMQLFLRFEIEKIIRFFKTKKVAKLITSFLFLVVFTLVSIGIYFFFVSGFRYVNAGVEEEIRAPLSLFLYELFLVILSGIIIFSSAVSGVFNLFRRDGNSWIMSSPSFAIFPKVVFVKSVLTSAWPLFVMFLPAALALNSIYKLHVASMVFIVLSSLILLVILNALTLLTILFASVLYKKVSQKVSMVRFSIQNFVIVLVIITGTILAIIWKAIKNVDLVQLFKADTVDATVRISDIGSHFRYLPTHPFALELVSFQTGDVMGALVYFLVLCIIALALVIVWWKVSYLLYPVWQKFQEGDAHVQLPMNASNGRKLYVFTGGTMTTLFKKEVLVFVRNYKGVLWFLFLFFIWLAQVGVNVISNNTIRKYQTDSIEQSTLLQSIQFIIALYFICAFTLRFVFPSFSVEKKTAWILASAPLSFRKIFFSKYFFYSLFFTVLGILMSTLNAGVLHVYSWQAAYSVVLFIVTVVGIVTFGLFLGAIFPSFDTDDPEVISTSMPGLFFTAISLIFGAMSAGVLYLLISQEMKGLFIVFIIGVMLLVGVMLSKVSRLVKTERS